MRSTILLTRNSSWLLNEQSQTCLMENLQWLQLDADGLSQRPQESPEADPKFYRTNE